MRNVVRALAPPLPGAFSYVGENPLVIAAVEVVDRGGSTPKAPGMVELSRGHAPIVWAADGPLVISSFVHDDAITSGTKLAELRLLTEGMILR